MENSPEKEGTRIPMVKLDHADYENIYLRIRDRLLKLIGAFVVLVFAFLGIPTVYIAIDKIQSTTEAAVNKYIQSEKFQKEVVATYYDKLRLLEKRAEELSLMISDQEKRAAQLPFQDICVSA